MDSILNSVKKLCGITEDYDVFDVDILINLNSVFSMLEQLGVGPKEGFTVLDTETIWEDYISDNPKLLNIVKAYVPLKVRQLFDPPTGAAAESALRMINEYEWRINVFAEENDAIGGESNGSIPGVYYA